MPTKTLTKKKKYPKLTTGKVYITTTSNNTIVTITDPQGNKILWWGTWAAGFKGTKESSTYAAEMVAKKFLKDAKDFCGLKEVDVIARGVGMGRDWVFKAINEVGGIDILTIVEDTPLQFGGCKGKRPKRN